MTAAGLDAAPIPLLGKAAGTLNTMQQFGAVFGVAVVTAVFNAHGSLATPAAETSGYQAALSVAAGASILGALVAIAIRRARTGATESTETETHQRADGTAPELASIASWWSEPLGEAAAYLLFGAQQLRGSEKLDAGRLCGRDDRVAEVARCSLSP